MRVCEDEKADRFGNYPVLRIKGKDANPQKIYEELWGRHGGQGYKFAIVFDCSKDEWEDPEKETPVYFLDTILDEIINYCGLEEVRRRLDEEARDIIRKHMNDGWIRVGEQLPEEGTQVIVTTEDGMVYGDIVYGYADETDSDPCFHRWDDEYWQYFKPIVIAWRPLPEPYYLEPEAKKPNWRENMLRKFDRRE